MGLDNNGVHMLDELGVSPLPVGVVVPKLPQPGRVAVFLTGLRGVVGTTVAEPFMVSGDAGFDVFLLGMAFHP